MLFHHNYSLINVVFNRNPGNSPCSPWLLKKRRILVTRPHSCFSSDESDNDSTTNKKPRLNHIDNTTSKESGENKILKKTVENTTSIKFGKTSSISALCFSPNHSNLTSPSRFSSSDESSKIRTKNVHDSASIQSGENEMSNQSGENETTIKSSENESSIKFSISSSRPVAEENEIMKSLENVTSKFGVSSSKPVTRFSPNHRVLTSPSKFRSSDKNLEIRNKSIHRASIKSGQSRILNKSDENDISNMSAENNTSMKPGENETNITSSENETVFKFGESSSRPAHCFSPNHRILTSPSSLSSSDDNLEIRTKGVHKRASIKSGKSESSRMSDENEIGSSSNRYKSQYSHRPRSSEYRTSQQSEEPRSRYSPRSRESSDKYIQRTENTKPELSNRKFARRNPHSAGSTQPTETAFKVIAIPAKADPKNEEPELKTPENSLKEDVLDLDLDEEFNDDCWKEATDSTNGSIFRSDQVKVIMKLLIGEFGFIYACSQTFIPKKYNGIKFLLKYLTTLKRILLVSSKHSMFKQLMLANCN